MSNWRAEAFRRQHDAALEPKAGIQKRRHMPLIALGGIPTEGLMANRWRPANLLSEELPPPLQVSLARRLVKQQEVPPVEGWIGRSSDDQMIAAVNDLTVKRREDQVCSVAKRTLLAWQTTVLSLEHWTGG